MLEAVFVLLVPDVTLDLDSVPLVPVLPDVLVFLVSFDPQPAKRDTDNTIQEITANNFFRANLLILFYCLANFADNL